MSQFLSALRISSPEHLQEELDILWAAFRSIGYPHSFIREALSIAKTRFYATLSTTSPPSSPAFFHCQTVVLPYQPAFTNLKRYMRASNFKIVYSSSNSIGRAVVCKKGSARNTTYHRSGVVNHNIVGHLNAYRIV